MYEKIVEKMTLASYPEADFWHDDLRVTERIELNIQDNSFKKKYIDELLNINHMPNLMIEWLKSKDIEVNEYEELEDKLLDMCSNQVIKSLIYLKYYLKRKRLNVRENLVKELIIKEEDKEILEFFEDDFYIGVLVLLDEYNKLLYYLLLDKAEKVSYSQYKLTINNSDEEESDKNIYDKFNLEELNNKEFLQENLKLFESYIGENKTSKLLHFNLIDNKLKLYIQRDFGTGAIFEQDKTILGEETKIFILEFTNGGEYILERSFEDKGREMASFLVTQLINEEISYEECEQKFSLELFKKFIKILLNNGDPKINLRYLSLNNFCIDTSPKFSLKSTDKDVSLAPAILEMEDKGFEILGNLNNYNNIERIDINFKIKDDDRFHVIPIYPEVDDKDCSLYFSDSNLTGYKTDYFINYLKRRYNLNVTFKSS